MTTAAGLAAAAGGGACGGSLGAAGAEGSAGLAGPPPEDGGWFLLPGEVKDQSRDQRSSYQKRAELSSS